MPVIFFSQEDSISVPIQKSFISDIYFSGGPYLGGFTRDADTQDINRLVKNKDFFDQKNAEVNKLNSDPNNFAFFSDVLQNIKQTQFCIQAGIYIKFKSNPIKKREAPCLKIGMGYFSNQMLFTAGSGSYAEKTTPDIYNSGPPNFSFINRDSISTKSIEASYQSQNINLESSFLLSTNTSRFLSAYCEVGALLGVNFNGITKLSYQEIKLAEDRNSASQAVFSVDQYVNITKEAIFKNSPNVSFGSILGLGVEMKIIKAVRLFSEVRITYRANNISNYKLTASYMSQFNLGLKISTKKS